MNHDPRPHIHRRRRAIDRLRTLTTGAAVAGLAGTAGFGVLAAATWSGNATADAAGSTTIDGGSGTHGTTGYESDGSDDTTGTSPIRIAPNTGAAQQPTVTVPRVQRVSGTGHASTGGSH